MPLGSCLVWKKPTLPLLASVGRGSSEMTNKDLVACPQMHILLVRVGLCLQLSILRYSQVNYT